MPATLSSLRIRNLALVEDLEWRLDRGFVAVTGETGSGKSIIIGALKLLVGERADKTLIRTGAESCTVEAVFEWQDGEELAALNPWLEEQGVEPCEGGQLLIKRAFSHSGSNRQFINASPTTLAVLKQLGVSLVDLHGPHDHQSLLSAEKQLELLDAFANAGEARKEYETCYRALNALVTEHDELSSSEAALERELDLLRHQVTEIEAAALVAGEEDGLLQRYQVVGNSRRLIELATQISHRLLESEGALLPGLNELNRSFRELEKLDPETKELAERYLGALGEIEDIASTTQRYAERLDLDPAQLAEMEERINLFETLKRKYGPTLGDVMAFGDEASARLKKIESRGEELERLAAEIEATRCQLMKKGERLSSQRAKAAKPLAGDVSTQLRDLGFKKGEFAIALRRLEKPGPHGLEDAEFLFAPNPGEPAKALKAIASSGEISRVMLALKGSLAGQDKTALLVFDEIDANVGGEIAHTVGAKMRSLGTRHQVLAITHLPQVAAAAATQFVVSKEVLDGRTISTLVEVAGEGRVDEVARMLGGKSGPAVAHARELLAHGEA